MILKLTVLGSEDPVVAFEVRPDRKAIFGRSAQADFSFTEDTYMSGKHFEVRSEESGWQVKDLDSSNGLHLNGERITESALVPGNELQAGSTTFVVEFVDEMPMPPPVLAIEALRNESAPLFAVIDAAASPGLYQLVRENPDRSLALFDGTPLEENAADGPHLVSFGDDENLLTTFVYAGWEANASIYLASEAAPEALAGHMKNLLFAKTEDGRRILFRYYDPRALRAFLPTCTAGEIAEFFGPASALFAEEDARRWRRFTRGADGLREDLLDFSAKPK